MTVAVVMSNAERQSAAGAEARGQTSRPLDIFAS